MKTYIAIFSLFAAILSSCGISNSGSETEIVSNIVTADSTGKGPSGLMMIRDTLTIGEPVELTFKVNNFSDTTQQFLKWETPFEPLMSKYLDVIDEDGTQVNYRGAMAKRAMPPSVDSYIKLASGDSLVATVDLLEGYAITRPARYTIVYVGQGMSGIHVRDSVSFVYR